MESRPEDTGSPATAPEHAAPPPDSVTRGFLFSDLRGYTDFVETHGAASAASLLERYRALVREAIGRFGGAEIKTEGDSFYVVFNSVSSAVRCAMVITGNAIAASVEHPDEPIRAGVGIHAGETIETAEGYVGSPVNIAARICSQAGPNEVLVSETVRALTRTVLPVHFEARGRRQLKGIVEPVALYAVVETAPGSVPWAKRPKRPMPLARRALFFGGPAVVAIVLAVVASILLRSAPAAAMPPGQWKIGLDMPITGDNSFRGIPVGGFADTGAVGLRNAMVASGHGTLPFLSWDGLYVPGADVGSFIHGVGAAAAVGSYVSHAALPPPKASFAESYRQAYNVEPDEYAAAAYACVEVIVASLCKVASSSLTPAALREALRAYAVDPSHTYQTVLGTSSFDVNGDAMQQFVTFYRVDPSAAGGKGDWVVSKQQDYGPPR